MITGQRFLEVARPHVGEAYVLGAAVPKDRVDYSGPWDCAEFVSWCVMRVTGKLYGCNPAGDAWTGFWARDAASKVVGVITPEAALRAPGAILLRAPPSGGVPGHIAFSDGLGGTVEALNGRSGVVAGKATGRRWDMGILIPGVNYATGPTISIEMGAPVVLRLGSTGPAVAALQTALAEAGFRPGAADGRFGQKTLDALVAYQRASGLVVDGEAGPDTLRALRGG